MNSHNSSRKTSTPVFRSTRLLDQLREQIRYLHYSLRTEDAYVYWVRKFVHFHGLKHPRDMGQTEVEAFLGYLATQKMVSVSTHHQALKLYQPQSIDVSRLRERLGLTQEQFAARFGFSVATLCHWERGGRSPNGAALVLLNVIDRDPRAVMRALGE